MEGVVQGCARYAKGAVKLPTDERCADVCNRYQAKASGQLRGILMRLANAMVSLPAAMFVDVQQRHTFQLQRYTLFLDDDYQVLPVPEPL